jgi:hypothetical protein
MIWARKGLAIAGVALLALTACGGAKEPRLMNLRSTTNGPDEFAIVPPKPLATPPDFASLPDPTPGGANLTDPHPMDDAITALGGQVPVVAGGVPAADGVLVRYAGRQGRAADIRAALAAEDLDFRRKHGGRILERAFGISTYFRAYQKSWLDARAELAKWRAAGVATPSAPPADTGR